MLHSFLDNNLWFAIAMGLILGWVFTKSAHSFARRIGLLDLPDGRRKIQSQAIPVCGGIAVFLATLISVMCVLLTSTFLLDLAALELRRLLALLVAVTLITLIGVVDDRVNLRARYKLFGQLAAAFIVVKLGGLVIEQVSLFGFAVEFGTLSLPLTMFWLLACMNSLNLIDGMDGLLGTVSVFALLGLGIMSLITGQILVSLIAFALMGSILGFLWFNLPPATIYMGDAGSLMIGLVVGSLAIPASLKAPTTVAIFCPIAILILPVLDTSAAIVRRQLTGRGIAVGDRGHFHHVLQRGGLTVRRILLLVALFCLMTTCGALASTAMNNDIFALLTALGVACVLLFTRLFGNAEFDLVRRRVDHFLRNSIRPNPQQTGSLLTVRLQGQAEWESVWQELVSTGESSGLCALTLDINSPYFHENFLARWSLREQPKHDGQSWKMEVPLYWRQHFVGRLIMEANQVVVTNNHQFDLITQIVHMTNERVSEQLEVLTNRSQTKPSSVPEVVQEIDSNSAVFLA